MHIVIYNVLKKILQLCNYKVITKSPQRVDLIAIAAIRSTLCGDLYSRIREETQDLSRCIFLENKPGCRGIGKVSVGSLYGLISACRCGQILLKLWRASCLFRELNAFEASTSIPS